MQAFTRRHPGPLRTALAACALLVGGATVVTDAEAGPYGRGGGYGYGHHSHYRGHGGWRAPVWGGIGFGLGVGVGSVYYGAPWYYGGPVVQTYVVPTPVYEASPAAVMPATATRPAPDPIIYPRNGQTAAQTESDRQACERWATTQPSALADASVFQRASAACMEGRGYTVR